MESSVEGDIISQQKFDIPKCLVICPIAYLDKIRNSAALPVL